MLEINDRWQAERVSRTCLAHARAHAARTRSRCVHAHAPTYTVNRYKLTYVKRLLLRRSVTIHYPRVLYGVTRLRFATGGPHDPAPYGIDKFLRGRCRIAEGTRVYHARTRARTRKGTEKNQGYECYCLRHWNMNRNRTAHHFLKYSLRWNRAKQVQPTDKAKISFCCFETDGFFWKIHVPARPQLFLY